MTGKNKRKTIILAALCLAAVTAAGLIRYKVQRVYECSQKVILLAFDDYCADDWNNNMDLFDQYGVKVTFFINAAEPTDFCYDAIDRGHEIGFHTVGHKNLTELSEEELYEQAVAPIEIFHDKGIELTSFAYPYGAYTEELNDELGQYYKTLRGAYFYDVKAKSDIPHCFIESYPLDNIYFESDEQFKETITELLDEYCTHGEGVVTSMYSHAISDGGDWCISPARLEILFQEAKKRDIAFSTFKKWQEPY